MWKTYPPKRNLADIVLRVQSNVAKQHASFKEEPEDAKTRRRRLYKIISEEKPTFPVQERNFYTMVMDNKEIIKLLGMLSTCTLELRQVCYGIELHIHLPFKEVDCRVELTGLDRISRSLEAL